MAINKAFFGMTKALLIKSNLIAVALLIGIVLYRTLSALITPGCSFSTPDGDGLGTLGWIFCKTGQS